MIRLAAVIETFEADFLAHYRDRLRPEHYRALAAIKQCRTQASPKMQVKCTQCAHQTLVPHCLAAIATARTVSTMRASSGWNAR
jgi:Transposase zinc-binding domain